MAQDYFPVPIDPTNTSGTDLGILLDNFQASILSGSSGATRPLALDEGGYWVDNVNVPGELIFYIYDGTNDVEIFRVNSGSVNSSADNFGSITAQDITAVNSALVPEPINPTEAATKNYVDTSITNTVQVLNTNKNYFINGDFSINQRVNFDPTIIAYNVDRWKHRGSGQAGGTLTVTQERNSTSGEYFLRYDQISPTDSQYLEQRIEEPYELQNKTLTITYDVNFSVAQDVLLNMIWLDVNGNSNNLIFPINFSVTPGRQIYTQTFTMPSITAPDFNNREYALRAVLNFGDNGTQASGTIEFYNAQLELGDEFTNFEKLKPVDELARCQRYFEKSYNQDLPPGFFADSRRDQGVINNQTYAANLFPSQGLFRVVKRRVPDVTIYNNTTGVAGSVRDNNQSTNRNVAAVVDPSETRPFRRLNIDAVQSGSLVSFHWTADAEI